MHDCAAGLFVYEHERLWVRIRAQEKHTSQTTKCQGCVVVL